MPFLFNAGRLSQAHSRLDQPQLSQLRSVALSLGAAQMSLTFEEVTWGIYF